MKIEGTHTFAAPREAVWPMIVDPAVLAGVLPGCETLVQVGENQYQGVLKIRVGPVQGKFDGTVTLSQINAPEGYRFSIDGRGAPGFVKGSGNLKLVPDNGSTLLQYEGDAQIGGRIASVSQRLIDTSARAIIRQSLEGLERRVLTSQAHTVSDAEETSPGTPGEASSSQTQFATGVLRDILDEYLPADRRGELYAKALLIIGAVFTLNIIDSWRMNRLARKVARRIVDRR